MHHKVSKGRLRYKNKGLPVLPRLGLKAGSLCQVAAYSSPVVSHNLSPLARGVYSHSARARYAKTRTVACVQNRARPADVIRLFVSLVLC